MRLSNNYIYNFLLIFSYVLKCLFCLLNVFFLNIFLMCEGLILLHFYVPVKHFEFPCVSEWCHIHKPALLFASLCVEKWWEQMRIFKE